MTIASEVEWLALPTCARSLILAQHQEIQVLHQENDLLRQQQIVLATELADLRERIGRDSRNSSKPPFCDGQGFKASQRRMSRVNQVEGRSIRFSSDSRKSSGRKRGGQQGNPGSGPELLPVESCDDVLGQHHKARRRCGTLPQGDAPEPHRHQVIDILQITAQVIEH